jgi:hypothetical protein
MCLCSNFLRATTHSLCNVCGLRKDKPQRTIRQQAKKLNNASQAMATTNFPILKKWDMQQGSTSKPRSDILQPRIAAPSTLPHPHCTTCKDRDVIYCCSPVWAHSNNFDLTLFPYALLAVFLGQQVLVLVLEKSFRASLTMWALIKDW